MKSWFTLRLSAWLRCRRGNVAIIFGLSLLPLILAAGGALDLLKAVTKRTAMMHALDNGALAAAKVALTQKLAGDPDWQDKGRDAGAFYLSPYSTIKDMIYNGKPVYNVEKNQMTAYLWFSLLVPTNFLKVVGIPGIRITGEANATIGSSRYLDLHIVVDNSGSMGIGAESKDIDINVKTLTCSFACHYPASDNNPQKARAAGSTLRIDVVRNALKSALQAAEQQIGPQGQERVRVAVYTLSNSLTRVLELDSNLDNVLNAIDKIDLTSDINQGGTNVTWSLKQLADLLNKAGNGKTKDKPSGTVILVTDGVQDSVYETVAEGKNPPDIDPNFETFEPQSFLKGLKVQGLDPAACQPLKAKGYDVMTLEAKYVIPDYGKDLTVFNGKDIFGQPYIYDPRYDFIKNTLAPQIEDNLKNCASSSDSYWQASATKDFETAISDMISKALLVVNLKLTK
jgi:hypothetical protein